MGRALAYLLVGLMAVPSGRTRALSFQTPQVTFTGRSDAVIVDVEVKRGTSDVGDLKADDFRLRDNGVEQDVQLVDAAAFPLDVFAIDDDSGLQDIAAARARFFGQIRASQALLRPGDRLGILTAAPTGQLLMPLSPVPAPVPTDAHPGGLPRVLDALAELLLVPGRPGRHRWILVQTTGADALSVVDPKVVPELAAQSDATVDVAFTRMIAGQTRNSLIETARLTGGRVFDGHDLSSSFRTVLDAFKHAYTLAYVPKGVSASGWHSIEVSVTRAGDTVAGSRRGYMGGQ